MEGIAKVALRVLYTVNTSPQYILAKAPEKIPLVPADTSYISSISQNHGRASLKICASAILRSSPELTPDVMKDFSVYVLDPLEDVHSQNRHSNGEPSGIAVGLGLLSTILSPQTPDSVTIIGTFVDYPKGEGSLEVVLSLRQVTPSAALSQIPQKPSSGFDLSNADSEDTPDHREAQSGEPASKTTTVRAFNAQNSNASSVTAGERKPDPAHFTRAHLLPTPYIGPPKRQYNTSSRTQNKRLVEPVGAQHTVIDVDAIPSPSSLSRAVVPAPPSSLAHELSQSATMLAALSSLSSGAENKDASSCGPDKQAPNPQLVTFLRAYLTALESQNTSSAPNPHSESDLPVQACDLTVRSGTTSHIADKENMQLGLAAQHSKGKELTVPTNTSPLGSSRHNVQTLTAGSNCLSSMVGTGGAADREPTGDASKKRKLGEMASLDEKAAVFGQSNAHSLLKHEDLSGIRVNRGWGGLRLRADGSFSGGHAPKPASPADCAVGTCPVSVHQRYFFRSSSTTAIENCARKGPYIVPDWARGVPPPAPPQRDPSKDDNGEGCCGRKTRKSKGLERLGGKNILKRSLSAADATARPIHSDPVARTEQKTEDKRSPTPRTSPHKSSPIRLPLIAQSSPLAKTAYASFFQVFQTSPCRSGNTLKSSFTTPKKPSSSATAPDSAKYSSLFTPSPTSASAKRSARVVEPTDMPSEPPSPTPVRKRARPPREFSIRTEAERQISEQEWITSRSETTDFACETNAKDEDPQEALRTSSNLASLNFDKVHDWSSLDLPPSSPPPPSSPSMLPYDSDLPCSDIPSSDMSGGETPPETSGQICNDQSNSNIDQSKSMGTSLQDHLPLDLNFSSIVDFVAGPVISDFSLDTPVEEGSAAESALNALRNGLGEIDFTEAWGLLDDVLKPTTSDSSSFFEPHTQDWLKIAGSTSQIPGAEEEPTVNNANFNVEDGDYASLVAGNFEELLKGCLV